VARQPSKTLIGAFVVGAVALATIGIIVFGSGRFFQKRVTCVMYFSGSIAGLSIGSPVEFRGVRVGEVTKIAAVLDPKTVSITIPVYVEIDPKSLIVLGDEDASKLFSSNRAYDPLMEKGLKAQLDIESFVTGKLFINMDFFPERPAKLLGLDPRYPEIPTIHSLKEEILHTLQKLPEKIIAVADGVAQLVNSPAAQDSLRDLDGLIRSAAQQIGPLMASMTSASDAARHTFKQGEKTLAQGEKTLAMKEGPSAELAASVTDAMKKASASLEQMQSTLGTYQKLAEPSGNLGHDLTRTLEEVDAAARSVRTLTDYLELHPEAVLKGKQ
jgi:paraquat-inducible protein B